MQLLKLNFLNRMPSFKLRLKRHNSESSSDSDNSPATPNNTPALSYITFHHSDSKANLVGLFDYYEFDETNDCVSLVSCGSMELIIPPAAVHARQSSETISNEIACATPPTTPVDGYTNFFPIFVEDLEERLEKLSRKVTKEEVVAKEEVIRNESACAAPPNTPVDDHTALFPIFVEDLKERLDRVSCIAVEEGISEQEISISNESAYAAPPNSPVDGYSNFFPVMFEDAKERLENHVITNPGAELVAKDQMHGEGTHACPTPFNTPVLGQDAFVAQSEGSSPIALRAASFDSISIKGLQKSLSGAVVASEKLCAVTESDEEGGHFIKAGVYNRTVKFVLPTPPGHSRQFDQITKARMRIFS